MNKLTKNITIWLAIAIAMLFAYESFGDYSSQENSVKYSTFINELKNDRLRSVDFTADDERILFERKDGKKFQTVMPLYDRDLLNDLISKNVSVEGKPREKRSVLMSIFISLLPMLVLIGFWIFMFKAQTGGGAGPMKVGKSKAKMLTADQVKTRFADVAGCDEAKEEVTEVVDFLRDPRKFQNLGGKIPKGILMVGPPGTGKTLLAKAIAGEAQVPFFTIAGSDFVEMFVGVGASRVRDLFDQAKKNAPCIIFIDEIDAVGRQRGGAGFSGGHDEREQTLNQMLVEMDGFEGNEGVIVIAATNRADVLDKALTRPGRFDRQVTVGLPDVKGREQILKVHMKNVPVADDVDPMVLARGTPGYSGADLANLVNEAALFSARRNGVSVTMNDFEMAKDKINMGPERRSMIMTEKQKESTAYHESGHAILGYLMPEHDPVHKVTIVPRGRALGVTFFLPEGDQISISHKQLESKLVSMYGGRLAEEIIYGKENISTGASNDIEVATGVARRMVTEWGFSKHLGPVLYKEEQGYGGVAKVFSEETSRIIDQEVLELVKNAYERGRKTLLDNIDILHSMKDALMKYETIDIPQIEAIMNRQEVPEPAAWKHNKPDTESSSENTE